MIATTKRQRVIMAHAVNLEARLEVIRKGRRRYDSNEFRNYYCSRANGDAADDIKALCEMGLMVMGNPINDGKQFYAHVTELGMNEIGLP